MDLMNLLHQGACVVFLSQPMLSSSESLKKWNIGLNIEFHRDLVAQLLQSCCLPLSFLLLDLRCIYHRSILYSATPSCGLKCKIRFHLQNIFDQPAPFALGLPPLYSGPPRTCQSYPRPPQPAESKLDFGSYQVGPTSLSSLDISWPSILFTSSIFPRNFSASSSSLLKKVFAP